ncbi:hypothetical protein ACFL59_07300 [Planctomycetota bacterium]
MAFVDPEEFDKGKRHASAYWFDQRRDAVAEAFSCMRIEACRFGFDKDARIAWTEVGGILVGLRFDTETGEYLTSFFRSRKA